MTAISPGEAVTNRLMNATALDQLVIPLVDFREADSRAIGTFLAHQLSIVHSRSNHPPEVGRITGTNSPIPMAVGDCPGFPNVTLRRERISLLELIEELARQWNATYTISERSVRFQRK